MSVFAFLEHHEPQIAQLPLRDGDEFVYKEGMVPDKPKRWELIRLNCERIQFHSTDSFLMFLKHQDDRWTAKRLYEVSSGKISRFLSALLGKDTIIRRVP